MDASPQEETCSLAQLLVSINGDKNICAMQKVGSGALDPDSIFEMIEVGIFIRLVSPFHSASLICWVADDGNRYKISWEFS